jgi:hypothetical protein
MPHLIAGFYPILGFPSHKLCSIIFIILSAMLVILNLRSVDA